MPVSEKTVSIAIPNDDQVSVRIDPHATAPATPSGHVGVQIRRSPDSSSDLRSQSEGAAPKSTSRTRRARALSAVGKTFLKRKKELQSFSRDFTQLQQALEPMEQFYFMRNDARPIHGLQNWDLRKWTEALTLLPHGAALLSTALQIPSPACDTAERASIVSGDFEPLSLSVKEKLTESLTMTQWQAVWTFQNEFLNHELATGAVNYMTPSLLSNMVFDREFPLGVEDRVIRERHHYAIQHSGLHRVGHRSNYAITCLLYSTMAFMTCFCIYYLLCMRRLAPSPQTGQAHAKHFRPAK